MPTYEYQCDAGHEFERLLPISSYQSQQRCDCGKPAKRIVSLPLGGYVQRECRYDSPVTGKAITSWAQRRDDLKRHGCSEYDPGMKQDYQRRIERENARVEARVDATVEAAYEAMPSHKRERLANELTGGLDAAPVRGTVPAKTVVRTKQ